MIAMSCQTCGTVVQARTHLQKYCEPCSEVANRKRQRRWARENPQIRTAEQVEQHKQRQRERTERLKSAGLELSKPASIGSLPPLVDLNRQIRVVFPFDWRLSKNAIWSLGSGKAPVYVSKEQRQLYDSMTLLIMSAARRDGRWFHAKVWIDIRVEMPEHRGDAINFLDGIADSVKKAIDVDDRWFAVRYIDWAIVKQNPRIIIGVGQEATEDMQICSYCGRTLTLEMFQKSKSAKLGVGRECKDCLSADQRWTRR